MEHVIHKINDFATSSEKKNIRDLYREKKTNLSEAANLEITYWKMRMMICLQIPTIF
jgi:hypothetical protein